MQGPEQQVITVTVPGQNFTKASGDGASVNRCVLQVYRNDAPYGDQIVTAVTGGKATFNLRLAASQTYDFVFWADCAENNVSKHYKTDDLSAITWNDGGYAGNSEEYDAFFGVLENYTFSGPFSEDVTLKRPFGQLNVVTTDMGDIPTDDLKPSSVTVTFTSLPTTFNAITGEVSGEKENVTYTADVIDAATGAISTDYIWALPDEGTLADFSMTFLNNDTEINTNDSFTNIPIRRNYRTNVSGNLLTKAGEFNVTIDPVFEEPDILVTELNKVLEAFANGGSVVLNDDVVIDTPLVLDGSKTVDIDLNGHDIINNSSVPDSSDPRYGNTTVFEVNGSATLNIRGDGKIQAVSTQPNEDGYRMAVYALGNSTVNIYGGNFYNNQDYNGGNAQLDLIYADGSAVINIHGGRFESACANSSGYWVLNLKDGSEAAINVYGGTFVNFDPSNSITENPVKDFVVEGSTVVKISDEPTPNGTYEVVQEGGSLSVPLPVDDADELVAALANPVVTEIEVAADLDLSDKTAEELTFSEHKTIDIAESATLKLGNGNWMTAQKGITLTGGGTVDNTSDDNSALGTGRQQKSLIHVMGGECLIDGVTLINDPGYHWHGDSNAGFPYNSSAISYWNDTEVTIRNARIVSGEFTLCGMSGSNNTATVTISDSYFESTSSNKDNGQHWAYAMRLFGSEITLDNCEVKGVQGGVSVEYCTNTVINGGKYYTVNTESNEDAYYPVYVTNGAVVTINGGDFIGANDRTSLDIGGTSAVVSGDNDTGKPVGSVVLKGGRFSGKAYNEVSNEIYEPADGYKYKEISGEDGLRWEVIAE